MAPPRPRSVSWAWSLGGLGQAGLGMRFARLWMEGGREGGGEGWEGWEGWVTAALAGVLGRRLAGAAGAGAAGGFGRRGRVVGRDFAVGCNFAGCILATAAGRTHAAAAGHTLAGRNPGAQAGFVGSRRIATAGSRNPTFFFLSKWYWRW